MLYRNLLRKQEKNETEILITNYKEQYGVQKWNGEKKTNCPENSCFQIVTDELFIADTACLRSINLEGVFKANINNMCKK